MKFCSKCGKQCEDNDAFCNICGNNLNGYSNNFNSQNTVSQESQIISEKSKIAAGILQLLLGIGIGRFYSGHTSIGIAQLLVTIFTCGIGAIWCFVDGIIILCSNEFYDAEGKLMK